MMLTIPAGLTIAGRVVDVTGVPSPAAHVILRHEHDDPRAPASGIATVGADGRFRFSGLEPGVYHLDARPDRTVEMRCASTAIESLAAGTPDLEGIRPEGPFVPGRLVDAQGAPILGASLEVVGTDGKAIASGDSYRDGVFKIEVPANVEFRLDARVF